MGLKHKGGFTVDVYEKTPSYAWVWLLIAIGIAIAVLSN